MDHYRIYLRAELAKLGNRGDAAEFLARGGCSLASLGLPSEADALGWMFSTQERVNAYVAGLDPKALTTLTECCDRWRRNGITDHLRRARCVGLLDVPVANVLLRQAEPEYAYIFERHHWSLESIASGRCARS